MACWKALRQCSYMQFHTCTGQHVDMRNVIAPCCLTRQLLPALSITICTAYNHSAHDADDLNAHAARAHFVVSPVPCKRAMHVIMIARVRTVKLSSVSVGRKKTSSSFTFCTGVSASRSTCSVRCTCVAEPLLTAACSCFADVTTFKFLLPPRSPSRLCAHAAVTSNRDSTQAGSVITLLKTSRFQARWRWKVCLLDAGARHACTFGDLVLSGPALEWVATSQLHTT